MTQLAWEFAAPEKVAVPSRVSAPFEERVQVALSLGITSMVERGRIPLRHVDEALRRFDLKLSQRELLYLCHRQGWRTRLVCDPRKFRTDAEYLVGGTS